jgi:hypothetical protein
MIPKSGVRFSDKIMRRPEGGEAPKGACQPCAAQHQQTLPPVDASGAAARQFGARPPSGATPRLSSGTLTSLTQLQAMLPGTWTARDPKIMRGESRRALPAPSCPSPVKAPHASAVVPRGMMPKAAPERVASPRGGTALAPLPKVPSRRRPSMSEIRRSCI